MIPNWYRYNYPHVLQKLAGAGYCVHNYGMSGRTAMRTGDHPYVREPRYLRSKAFQPDIVLLKFGTNDSKPQNWLGREEFKKQYREVLESYLNLNSKPRVILLQPAAPARRATSIPLIFSAPRCWRLARLFGSSHWSMDLPRSTFLL